MALVLSAVLAAFPADEFGSALLPAAAPGVLPTWCAEHLELGQKCRSIGGRSAVLVEPSAAAAHQRNALCHAASDDEESPSLIPLMLYFGHNSSAECAVHRDQHNESLTYLAEQNAFAVLCFEAMANASYRIPEEMVDHTPCGKDDSTDLTHVIDVLTKVGMYSEKFDLSRLYVAGVSRGASFAGYAAHCLRDRRGIASVSSVAMVNGGLKLKGDGLTMPQESGSSYRHGECPSCKAWPFVPKKQLGLRLCAFAGSNDTLAAEGVDSGDHFRSAVQMVGVWQSLGNEGVGYFLEGGGHLQVESYEQVAGCLQIGTPGVYEGSRIPLLLGLNATEARP